MKWNKQALSGIAALALGAVSAVDGFADAKPNPYETIIDRNPFGLKPAPPPPDTTAIAPPPAPQATVELTGITSFLSSKKRALLEITPGPGKPVQRPILAEGERVESVEVVSINVEKNEVTIKNGNVTTNLGLKVTKTIGGATQLAGVPPPNSPVPFNPAQFGVPAPAAAPSVFTPGTASGNIGNGRGNAMVFGAQPTGNPAGGGSVATFGAQQPVAAAFGGTAASGAAYGAGAYGGANPTTPGASGDFKTIPPRPQRAAQPQPQPQGHIDPAIQYINLKAQEQQVKAQGRPFPPVPPIPGLE